jgi:hypothetical protein
MKPDHSVGAAAHIDDHGRATCGKARLCQLALICRDTYRDAKRELQHHGLVSHGKIAGRWTWLIHADALARYPRTPGLIDVRVLDKIDDLAKAVNNTHELLVALATGCSRRKEPMSVIAARAGCETRSARKALGRLEASGLFDVHRVPGRAGGIYARTLRPELFGGATGCVAPKPGLGDAAETRHQTTPKPGTRPPHQPGTRPPPNPLGESIPESLRAAQPALSRSAGKSPARPSLVKARRRLADRIRYLGRSADPRTRAWGELADLSNLIEMDQIAPSALSRARWALQQRDVLGPPDSDSEARWLQQVEALANGRVVRLRDLRPAMGRQRRIA